MGYLNNILDPKLSKKVIKRLADGIRDSGVEFDFIAIRGMSGAIIAGALSIRLNKPVVIVRKVGDQNHSSDTVDHVTFCNPRNQSYIIVDDGIATGKTMANIIHRLDEINSKCRAIFLYIQGDINSMGVELDSLQKAFNNDNVFHPSGDSFHIYDLQNKLEYTYIFP